MMMEYIVVAGVIIVLAILITVIVIKYNNKTISFEDYDGHEFEEFCANLLEENGFEEVEVTKGSGDFGADILAIKDMVTYAIQCKVYSGPVGVKAVQEIAAGRDYYDRMVGVVMTNQTFTAPAKEAAKKLKIILWDGEYLEKLMNEE